ncbi:NifU family protein [Salinactinospora qingdaonensis]|uniref:NifU family protein n=1 Tax=Salinactinospora qingdaonensis TaxID=702744 RepID=A0ABP7FAJ0_9ACTN
MTAGSGLNETSERVEALLAELAGIDPTAGERAEEVVRLLVELYGTGLEHIMATVAADGQHGSALQERLVEDDLVAGLLILHGLHPVDTTTRVQRALDRVRPYLGSHAGGVELVAVDDDTVRLRLQGNCDGCPSSAATVKLSIERAIAELAPEISAVEVEGLTTAPSYEGFVPLESVRAHDSASDSAAPRGVAV